jgi:hypothetical protein
VTALIKYDAACRALADAKTFDAVHAIREEMEHVKLYGRQINDRRLIAEATEVQARAERRLGELLIEAKTNGWIREGRRTATVPTPEQFTLEEAGIDRKLSASSQKLAAIPADEFETGIRSVRDRIISGDATIINGARAIMASRQEPDGLDYFPTPPWATRALIERIFPHLGTKFGGIIPKPGDKCSIWEPACGEGHISEVLREYFADVTASDVHDHHSYPDFLIDFLNAEQPDDRIEGADWIITNPPFEEKALAFVERARDRAPNVAMFFRSQWAVEGIERYERLFRDAQPTLNAFFVERVNLCKSRWDPKGTTATAYCWLIWIKGGKPIAPFYIPPGCRETLSKPDDAERFTTHPVTRRAA